jgi:hypothetical protein
VESRGGGGVVPTGGISRVFGAARRYLLVLGRSSKKRVFVCAAQPHPFGVFVAKDRFVFQA